MYSLLSRSLSILLPYWTFTFVLSQLMGSPGAENGLAMGRLDVAVSRSSRQPTLWWTKSIYDKLVLWQQYCYSFSAWSTCNSAAARCLYFALSFNVVRRNGQSANRILICHRTKWKTFPIFGILCSLWTRTFNENLQGNVACGEQHDNCWDVAKEYFHRTY